MNNKHADDTCDRLDAHIFSGDLLFDDEDREELKQYLARWLNAINEHESFMEKDK